MNSQYEIDISTASEDSAWDAFVAATPGGHHVQTSMWARVKALLGWGVTRIVVRQRGQIVGGAQVLLRPVPLLGAVGYITKGPLLAARDPALLDRIVRTLQDISRDRRLRYCAIQPPGNGHALAAELPRLGFRPSPMKVVPAATVLVDLTRELEDIMAGIRKETRYGIRRSQKAGVTVREGTEADIPAFHRVVTAMGKRRTFTPFSREYFTNMWRLFAPLGYLKLIVAEFDGEVAAAQIIIPFGDTVLAKQGGWSGKHGQHRPSEAMDWFTIQWAKTNGYKYYDLEGIEVEAARALLAGESLPARFQQTPTSHKLSYGGQVTLFPGAYDYVYSAPLRWAYTTIYRRVADWPLVSRAAESIRTRGC